jgi:hypothetical protein
VRGNILVGFQSAHHHLEEALHVGLELSNTDHVKVASVALLLNDLLQASVKEEESQDALERALTVKGLGVCVRRWLHQLAASVDVELFSIHEVKDSIAVAVELICPTEKPFRLKHCLDHVELFDGIQ